MPGRAAATLCPLCLLGLLAVARRAAVVRRLDERVEAWRAGLPPAAERLGRGLDAVGGHVVLPPATAAAVLWSWRRRRRLDAGLLVAASAGADLTLHTLKRAVDRPRGGEGVTLPAGASFPSGHATTALTIGVTTARAVTRGRGATTARVTASLATATAAAVGVGRLLAGRRAASDVAGGLLLGWAWLTAQGAVEARLRDGGPS